MDNKYTIILADGTTINGLARNGTNYISENPLNAAVFDGNCSPLQIAGDDISVRYEYAELVHFRQEVDGCYIAFREISEEEIRNAKLRADIDYIAMMTDTDLGEA